MQHDEVLECYIRSSLAIKHNITLSNSTGIVDADYFSNPDNDGNIGCFLVNHGDEDVHLEAGERVFQGIFKKYLTVDNDKANEERTGGFGSTGK